MLDVRGCVCVYCTFYICCGPTTMLLESIGDVSHVSLVNTIRHASRLSAQHDRTSKSQSVPGRQLHERFESSARFHALVCLLGRPTPLC